MFPSIDRAFPILPPFSKNSSVSSITYILLFSNISLAIFAHSGPDLPSCAASAALITANPVDIEAVKESTRWISIFPSSSFLA